jgi:hypothetical protein
MNDYLRRLRKASACRLEKKIQGGFNDWSEKAQRSSLWHRGGVIGFV